MKLFRYKNRSKRLCFTCDNQIWKPGEKKGNVDTITNSQFCFLYYSGSAKNRHECYVPDSRFQLQFLHVHKSIIPIGHCICDVCHKKAKSRGAKSLKPKPEKYDAKVGHTMEYILGCVRDWGLVM